MKLCFDNQETVHIVNFTMKEQKMQITLLARLLEFEIDWQMCLQIFWKQDTEGTWFRD